MNSIALPGPLVNCTWLASHLRHANLVVLDASMKAPAAGNSPSEPTPAVRIPGARVFDFDKTICDRASPLPHMMPSAELLQSEVRALGINRDSVIVVYDRIGVYSSPRAWWMFRAMGHDQIAVLDGGLPAWLQAGLPCVECAATSLAPGDFLTRPRRALFCDADHVASALNDPHCKVKVLDARSEGRFRGREAEPRPGLRQGHMPNAINLPYTRLQDQGHMRSVQEISDALAPLVGPDQRLIFSCGSGVTACILALGAELAGYSELCVYDGSWSEWGLPSARPVVKDSAE